MPRISDFRVIHRNEQPVLTIAARTDIDNLIKLICDSYKTIEKYLDELGEMLTGVPFVTFHNNDLKDLDVEICFPTRKPLNGRGDIKPSAIPSGKSVFCMFFGNSSERKLAYDEMTKWIINNNHKPFGNVYEHYYNSCECPKEKLLTKLEAPLK